MPVFKNILFPTAISYGSTGGPKFKTTIFGPDSGYENVSADWEDLRCEFDVSEALKTGQQMRELLAFFCAVAKGRAYGFRYKDWEDFSFAQQVIGFGDGSTTIFPVFKTYTFTDPGSGATRTYNRPLSKLAWNTLAGITVDGVTQIEGADYWISYNSGKITFTGAPPAYAEIKIGYGEFHVPVRFDTDDFNAAHNYFDTLSMNSLQLVEVRDWVVAMTGGRALDDYQGEENPSFGQVDGVHFDGSTWLETSSLTAPDSGKVTVAFWFKLGQYDGQSGGRYFFAADNGNALALTDASAAISLAEFINDATTVSIQGDTGSPCDKNTWHHFLCSADVTVDPNLLAIYIDGFEVTGSLFQGGINGPLLFNGRGFTVGDFFGDSGRTNALIGDMADFWFAANVSLLNEGGKISQGYRNRFVFAGCPIFLGDDGSRPTGTAPDVFLHRAPNAPASNFAANLGTGGSLALTGTLTDSDFGPPLAPAVFPYAGAGVAFDGSSKLFNSALVADDSYLCSFSFWFRPRYPNDFASFPPITASNGGLIAFNIGGTEVNIINIGNSAHYLNVFLGTDDGTSSVSTAQTLITTPTNGWRHVVGTVDFPLGILKVYMDGREFHTETFTGPGDGNMSFSGKSLTIGNDGISGLFTGDLAEVWIAPGQTLLTGSVIAPETLAKFIDLDRLVAVDLGDDGSAPTTVSPAVYLRRLTTEAPEAFVTNRGTGGTFALTGSLTSTAVKPQAGF